MRRLLLIAFYFPPEPVAGALRPNYLAKYLPEFGWQATVIARPLGEESVRHQSGIPVVTARVLGQSLENSVRGAMNGGTSSRVANGTSPVRRALRWARKTLSFPDRAIGWLPAAVARGCAVAGRRHVDAIVSTATPATAHIVASAIARRYALPWIADYRDPWAGNPGAQEGPIRAAMQLYAERRIVRRAAVITTISRPIARQLEGIHGREVTVIPNASEPRDWEGLESIRPQEFVLTYTGSMYAEHRSPELLFASLAALRSEGDPAGCARVFFFGPSNEHLMEEARRFGVDDMVTYGGIIPRAEALAAQRRASDLLVFLNMDPSSQFELGSKIIEYTRARRPILAFGPPDSVMREHLTREGLGWFASDVEGAKLSIRLAYRRFLAGDVELPAPATKDFDARDLAKAFAAQLDAVT